MRAYALVWPMARQCRAVVLRPLAAGWPDGQPTTLRRCTFETASSIEAVAWSDKARGYRVEPGTETPLPTRIL